MDETLEQQEQITEPVETPGSEQNVDDSRAWINELPEDVKDAKTWSRFTVGDDTQMVSVPDSLLKTHLNLEGMLGDRNKLPETPEEQKEFYTKLGWEPEFEKYSEGIARAEMPDGIEYDTSEEEFLLQKAHEHHIPLKDAQALYDDIVKTRITALQDGLSARDAYLEKVEEEFKREYHGDLDVMKNRAKAAMSVYGDDDLIDLMETAEIDGYKFGDHPKLFNFFAKLGKKELGLGDERGKSTSGEDASSIQEQIDEIMANPAYWDANHSMYNSLNLKAEKLFKRQAGEI